MKPYRFTLRTVFPMFPSQSPYFQNEEFVTIAASRFTQLKALQDVEAP
jgi:hypothetical protein